MLRRRLVGDYHQPCLRVPGAHLGERREEHGLVRGPAAAGDQGVGRVGDREQRVVWIDGCHHAEHGVDAGVAGDHDTAGWDAESDHAGTVGRRDGPHGLQRLRSRGGWRRRRATEGGC